MADQPRLGEILLDAHILRPEHITAALQEQKTTGLRFGEALIKLGFVQAEDVNWGLAHQLGIPFVRVRPDMVEPQAIALIPESVAREHNMIPYVLIGDRLTIVVDDPMDLEPSRAAEYASGKPVNLAIGLADEIARAIDRCYSSMSLDELDPTLAHSSLLTGAEIAVFRGLRGPEMFVNALLEKSSELGASSLHWEPFADHGEFRIRVHGKLENSGAWPTVWHRALIEALKRKMTDVESVGPHDEGLITFDGSLRRHQFFATFVHGRFGVAATMLNMTCPDFPESLPSLGLDKETFQTLMDVIGGRAGLALLVGTEKMEKRKFIELLLVAKHAGEKRTHTLTRMPWFSDARYVQIKAPFDNAEGYLRTIRAVLAQEPDIVFAEDAWDRGVFAELVRSSLERRYVVTGLSLPSALSGLQFALESAPNRTALAEALRGVVAAAFFRRLCERCREPEPDRAKAARVLKVPRSVADEAAVYRRVGCEHCRGGVTTLVPIVEILCKDETLESEIKSGIDAVTIRNRLLAAGHRDLEDHVRGRVLAGELDLDDFKMVERR